MIVPFSTSLRQGCLACLAVAMMVMLAGCAARSEPRLPPPEPGLPPTEPVGMDVHAFQQRQINAAFADRLTVYRNEWADAGVVPGPYGSQHIEEIASLAADTSQPILIERDPDPKLNEVRRDFVVRYLAQRHVPDVADRVMIGRPAALGISGDDAIEIYRVRSSAYSAGSGGGSSAGQSGSQSGGGF